MKKNYLILFIISFFLIAPIYAKEVEPDFETVNNSDVLEYVEKKEVETFDREDKKNLGVNKRWKITSSNRSNVLSTPYVDASKKVYDFEDILTDEEEETLYEMAIEYQKETGFDIAIVDVSVPFTCNGDYCGTTNEDYAADFYDYNDFGLDDKYYSGVIILRNQYIYDGLGYLEILYFGEAQFYYGGAQTGYNSRHDSIYSSGAPYFTNGEYYQAFINIIDNLSFYYNSGKISSLRNYKLSEYGYAYNPETQKVTKNGKIINKFQPSYTLAFIISAIITPIVMITMRRKNKMVYKATEAHEFLNRNTIKYTKRIDTLVSSHVSKHYIDTSSGGSGGGGGGGFSSSGGSSGGGHSGGGGRC